MLINVLLSTFGIAWLGTGSRSDNVDTKFVRVLYASQIKNFPATSTTFATELPMLNPITSQLPETLPTQKSQTLEETTSVLVTTSIPLPETKPTQSCETGYTGTFPDCKRKKPEKCRHPTIGIHPDCFLPPCPPRYSGTYPKCKQPTDQICPFGSTGSFPNCVVSKQSCPQGSNCDNVILKPSLQTSTQVLPSTTEHQLTEFNKMKWEDFKRIFNKTYTNQTNEEHHRHAFLHNQEIVEVHNKRYEQGLETYSLAVNELSDQTRGELIGVDPTKTIDNKKLHDIRNLHTESVRNEEETVNNGRLQENIRSETSGVNN